jgi:uncharacterized protein (DUF305 family)
MHKYLTLAALLIATPLAAQTPPPSDHGAMGALGAMKHDSMPDMKPEMAAKPATPMPMMNHDKMSTMDHAKMGGMGGMGEMPMMKNTAANPYTEAGMAMHHKMMVTGADASETWTRQMIELHRGAIAMAKIAVAQAMDKETRAMAEKDIATQDKDIAGLQSWLKRHGKTAQ